jgi:hypothetical protein
MAALRSNLYPADQVLSESNRALFIDSAAAPIYTLLVYLADIAVLLIFSVNIKPF